MHDTRINAARRASAVIPDFNRGSARGLSDKAATCCPPATIYVQGARLLSASCVVAGAGSARELRQAAATGASSALVRRRRIPFQALPSTACCTMRQSSCPHHMQPL